MVTVVLVWCILISNAAFAEENISKDKTASNLEYLEKIMNLIKERYNYQVTDEQLIEGAVNGMFDTMDQYTDFFDLRESDDFLNDIKGSYVGIGVRIFSQANNVFVSEVFEKSSADKAGIINGDIIVKVGEESVEGKSSEETAELIKGREGTKVYLEIKRAGQKDLVKVEVERAKIKVDPVTYDIKNDIGYIKLDIFNSNSDYCIKKALKEIDGKNINKLILDLRDNPGGTVSEVVKIAERFVPKGLITKLDFKSETIEDEEYYSENENLKYELVVLVNESSASASEILAGAIQDTGVGVLVGTNTYGKGKVQNIYPILTPKAYSENEQKYGIEIVDGDELINEHSMSYQDDEVLGWTKITTGEYYTPNGRMIDGIGLEPDFYIENSYIKNNIDIRDIDTLSKKIKPYLDEKSIDVLNCEKLLKFLGYKISNPDVIFDSQTADAVREFQKDNGFYSYGVLDFSTQEALNEKLENLVLEYDKQMAKAIELLKD